MTKEEAMFAKCDEGGSQQGSSTKNTIPMTRLTDYVWSSVSARPSRVVLSTKDVKNEDLGSVGSRGKGKGVEHGEEACSSSLPGEGILINKPRSKILEANMGRLRYLNKFP